MLDVLYVAYVIIIIRQRQNELQNAALYIILEVGFPGAVGLFKHWSDEYLQCRVPPSRLRRTQCSVDYAKVQCLYGMFGDVSMCGCYENVVLMVVYSGQIHMSSGQLESVFNDTHSIQHTCVFVSTFLL